MREKLQQLMREEGLTLGQLADALGVRPSNISHLMSGRNKPGFDFVQRLYRRFPRLNPHWLFLDVGPMYLGGGVGDSVESGMVARSGNSAPNSVLESMSPASAGGRNPDPTSEAESVRVEDSTHRVSVRIEPGLTDARKALSSQPVRMVMLYDDGTFDEYLRRK